MGGGSQQSEGSPGKDRVVDVALAEFNALRAEIVGHTTAQYAFVGVALTALGVILGLVIREGGDGRLPLAVPPLTALVSLLHAAISYRLQDR